MTEKADVNNNNSNSNSNSNSNNGNNMDFNLLQQLMGGVSGGNQDPMAMMGRIQRLQKIMNSNGNESSQQEVKKENKEENRREQMLYTALPFIQEPFRSGIFNITKFLEIQRVLSRKEEDVLLEAREKGGGNNNGDNNGNPLDMLKAIKPFLHNDEQKQVDMMVRLMGMGSMFGGGNNNGGMDNSVDNTVDDVDNVMKK